MNELSNIYSTDVKRRLPRPSHGVDINFCRNLQCGLFMVPPNPFDKRGKSSAKVEPNMPHGKVNGSKAEKAFICGACGQGSIIKNNRPIVQEYRRLRNRFSEAFPKDICQTQGGENYGALREDNPTLYRKSGRTAKGAQRWKCKACLRTYSVGSSIRRQKHSHANRDILWMLTNGTPISKICDFTELSR